MRALCLLQGVTPARDLGALPSGPYEYLKLILVFGFVLILVFFILRVWLPRITGVRQLSSGPIRVVARFSLEPRKNLYIVQAGGSYFLVGTSDAGVHYLTTLDTQAVEASASIETPTARADFRKFMQAWKRPPGKF